MRFPIVSRLFLIALTPLVFSACAGTSNTVPNFSPQNTVHRMSAGGNPTVSLPISQFVAAQGTCSSAICGNNAGGYFSWGSENAIGGCPAQYFVNAIVDYAGVSNAFIKSKSGGAVDLGTAETGQVSVSAQPDGTAIVKVEMDTTNALVYSRCTNVPAPYPLLFGHSPEDVATGSTPAIGSSHISANFTMPSPTSALPDLMQLAFFGFSLPGYTLNTVKIHSNATGPLASLFGVRDGTPGNFSLTQIGAIKNLNGGEDGDTFAAEVEQLSVAQ